MQSCVTCCTVRLPRLSVLTQKVIVQLDVLCVCYGCCIHSQGDRPELCSSLCRQEAAEQHHRGPPHQPRAKGRRAHQRSAQRAGDDGAAVPDKVGGCWGAGLSSPLLTACDPCSVVVVLVAGLLPAPGGAGKSWGLTRLCCCIMLHCALASCYTVLQGNALEPAVLC